MRSTLYTGLVKWPFERTMSKCKIGLRRLRRHSSVWPPPLYYYWRARVSGLILIELHSKLTCWVSRVKTVSSLYPLLRTGSCQPF